MDLDVTPSLSPIGFGSEVIGGGSSRFNQPNEKESLEALVLAFRNGINWVDTAPIYGEGKSEKLIGQALKIVNKKIFISTKCGLKKEYGQIKKDLRPEKIFKEIDQSLLNLGVDVVDLYQCHWPDSSVPIKETWEAMISLIKKGKVRYIGVCNFSLQELEEVKKFATPFSIQLPYSLFNRKIEQALIPFCKKNSIKILGYGPLQSGLLSGNFCIDKLDPGDWRRKETEWFCPPYLQSYLDKAAQLKIEAIKKDISLPQLAISWAIKEYPLIHTIVGMRNNAQVLENLQVLNLKKDYPAIF